MPRLISTYIFKEMLVPFVLCTSILTVTVLLSKTLKLVELVLSHGVGPSFIFWFILSILPTFLVYIIPISFLICVLLAYARLSTDHEIVAMKACGINLTTLLKPVLLFALIIFTFTLILSLYIFPWGNITAKKILFEIARTNTSAGIEEQTFYNRFKGSVIYVDHKREDGSNVLEGVFISQTQPGKPSTMILAKRGIFVPNAEDLSVSLVLEDGSIQQQLPAARDDKDKDMEGGGAFHIIDFQRYTLTLELKGGLGGSLDRVPNRELYPGKLREKINKEIALGKSVSQHLVDFHRRIALPASIFIFALLGVPLGIKKIRSAGHSGFPVALVIILIYFTFFKWCEALGENDRLDPMLAMWLPNIVLGAVGLYIFNRSAKDLPLKFIDWIDDLVSAVEGLLKRLIPSRKSA